MRARWSRVHSERTAGAGPHALRGRPSRPLARAAPSCVTKRTRRRREIISANLVKACKVSRRHHPAPDGESPTAGGGRLRCGRPRAIPHVQRRTPYATHLSSPDARRLRRPRSRRHAGRLLERLVVGIRERRLPAQLQAGGGGGPQDHRLGLQGQDRRRGQDRHRRLGHLPADAPDRGRQVQPADHLQHQRPGRSGHVEGLRARPVRHRVRQGPHRHLDGADRRERRRLRLPAGDRGLRAHLQRRDPQQVLRPGGRQGHVRRRDQGLRQAQGGRRGHAGQEGRPRHRGRLRLHLPGLRRGLAVADPPGQTTPSSTSSGTRA